MEIGDGDELRWAEAGHNGEEVFDLTIQFFDFGPRDALKGHQNVSL